MKQINLHWINAKTIPYILLGIAIVLLFMQNSCSNNTPKTRVVKVTVPEVKGSFKPEKPIHDTIRIPKEVIKWKEVKVEIENPINMDIFNKYIATTDSVKRLKILLKAIEIKEFSKNFEDNDVSITAKGTVQGEVKSIGFNYVIKEKIVEAEIKEKETIFKLSGSLETGLTKQFDKFAVKAGIDIENKKGNSILAGYDTEQRIWLGYKFKVFQIKW